LIVDETQDLFLNLFCFIVPEDEMFGFF